MLQTERMNDPLVAARTMLRGQQAQMWTALPGTYQGAGQSATAKVQPTIMAQTQDIKTGKWSNVQMPLLLDCPIVWPGGGGYVLTFPLAIGDEGLVVFGSRCIDAWWQQGGVQPQAEIRMHDLSDGFFIPAPMSKSKAPPAASSCQLRSIDGNAVVDLDTSSAKMALGELIVQILASGRVDLGRPGGDAVMTVGGPSSIVFAALS